MPSERLRVWSGTLPCVLALFAGPTALTAQIAPPPAADQEAPPAVEAGRFDTGRMWTFEYPPLEYFQEAYGFTPDDAWLTRARTAALRIPNCSASLVSPNGLLMTNHHCARTFVSQVSQPGENLLDEGFYAASLAEERPVQDFTVDQLIEIVDVTDEIQQALEGVADDRERAQRREAVTQEIAARLQGEQEGEAAGIDVEMIALWDGARYSAYVFRQYTEAKLVMAPEVEIGFFGGDPDNFTYPRYNLDVAFFRVYQDGEPLQTDAYFRFNPDGASEGDPVFVIGNPGSTSRLQTVAELEFRRDVGEVGIVEFYRSRAAVLQEYIAAYPEQAEALDLSNTLFSLLNSDKALTGVLNALEDPRILARKAAAEESFQAAIDADSTLQAEYGGLIERMAGVQDAKRREAGGFAAFLGLTSELISSATLRRALFGFQYIRLRGQVDQETLDGIRDDFLAVEGQPRELDDALIAARIEDLQRGYGEDAPFLEDLLGGRTPEGLAAVVTDASALSDSAGAAAALDAGLLSMTDPAIQLFVGYLQPFASFQSMLSQTGAEEDETRASLGRARFAVYGTSEPPDATFSLRLADGVVSGYAYNGTEAPVYTTFYGLYDRHYSHVRSDTDDWALPDRWLAPPAGLDLATPLDFVSTADIIGGSSGSAVVDRDLRVVGLAFDGNVESLPGDFIFLPEEGNRCVAVDARGILAALDHVYDADRIVLELTTGRLVETEAEADALR